MFSGKRKQKAEKGADFVDRAVSYFQTAVPNWSFLILLELMTGALKSLRYCMESGDPEVNWHNPFVELRYPARWDWKKSKIVFIRKPSLKQAKGNEDKFIESLHRYHIAQVHWALTNGTAIVKKGSEVSPLLDQETWEMIENLSSEDQAARLAELHRPFVIGCFSLSPSEVYEVDPADFPEKPLPPSMSEDELDSVIARSLHDWLNERMKDVPEFRFDYPVRERVVTGNLMFAFPPLVVDEEEHRAYYPIITGLIFDEPDSVPTMNVSEQAEFWGRLLQQLEDLRDSFLPSESDEESEFESVLLEGIEKSILPVYAPWIRGTHESALVYLQQSGELPAVSVPRCRLSQEPEQPEFGARVEEVSRDRPRVIVNLRSGYLTIDGKTRKCSARALKAAAFALKCHQGGPNRLGRLYFDRVELCKHLEITTETKIRDIFRNTPFYSKNSETRLVKKYGKVKNAYYLDIDIQNSYVED